MAGKERYTAKPDDIEPTETNPFHYELMYPVGGRKEKNKTVGTLSGGDIGFVTQSVDLTNKKSGEVMEGTSLIMNVKKRVDAEGFVKMYTNGLASIFDLDTGAQKVLKNLLLTYTEEDTYGDLIWYNFKIAQDTGYPHKRTAWRNGLNLLMTNEFLCPCARGDGWYWLNPTLFYRGDRMAIVNEYIKNPPKGTIEVEKSKPTGDVELDQVDMFDGKTERERGSEKPLD